MWKTLFSKDTIPLVILGSIGFISVYYALSVFTKKRVFQDNDYVAFRKITPLPEMVNYYLVRFFVGIMGFLLLILVVYLFIGDINQLVKYI